MEDIEARREARRRKILENSEKRLKKITGVEDNNKSKIEGISSLRTIKATREVDTTLTTSKNSGEVTNSKNNGELTTSKISLCTKTKDESSLATLSDKPDKDVKMLFYNPRLSENVSVTQLERPLKSNSEYFLILILPIIWSLVISVCNKLQIGTDVIYINKIFIPLLVFEVQDYFWSPNIDVSSSFLSSLILLAGIPYSRKVDMIVQCSFRIIQDVMIYFFVFLVTHLFINFFIYNI